MSGFLANKLESISKNSTIHVEIDGGGNNRVSVINRFKIAKSKNTVQPKRPETGFLIPRAKLAFVKLKQAFIKAIILYYYDPEYHI